MLTQRGQLIIQNVGEKTPEDGLPLGVLFLPSVNPKFFILKSIFQFSLTMKSRIKVAPRLWY